MFGSFNALLVLIPFLIPFLIFIWVSIVHDVNIYSMLSAVCHILDISTPRSGRGLG